MTSEELLAGFTAKYSSLSIPLRAICRSHYEDCIYRNIDIEDAEQEAWLGVLKAANKYDPSHGSEFATYAIQWAKTMFIRYKKRACRYMRINTVMSMEDHDERFTCKPFDPLNTAMTLEAIESIGPRSSRPRQVVEAYYIGGMTYGEIASHLKLDKAEIRRLKNIGIQRASGTAA